MYFNDVHILYYVLFILVGGFIGQFIDYVSKCFIKERKIFTKESFSKYKKIMLPNYILILGIAVAYAGLLYKFGLHAGFIENLDLIKYVILIPMLACAFYVDLKEQIIPNRLNLLMFEIGLVFVFIYGFININISLNLLLGMFAGAGIFLFITLIGALIAGKEAMGFGDVKLMGALGLFFGWRTIIIISLIAFLLGAIIGVALIICKRKTGDEYIPFGPFIVIATIIAIFVPFNVLFFVLIKIFTLGTYKAQLI